MSGRRVPNPARHHDGRTSAAAKSADDGRVFVEVSRDVEWLCSPAVILGWSTTAAGYADPIDVPRLP